MSHRYGRHGLRAWKRLQERKYVHRAPVLPVPVAPPTTMIVRIVVPATTERITVILMSENPQPGEAQQTRNQQFSLVSTPGGLQPSGGEGVPTYQGARASQDGETENDSLVSHARLKARSDIRDMKRRATGGKVIILNRPKMEERIETLVDAYFEYLVSRGASMPDPATCRELERRYRDTYLLGMQEGIASEQVQIHLLSTPIEVRLRELAIEDRKQFPQPWRRPFHQRDLAVIQVLLELGIGLDQARERLETIHDHADIYERYYANPREEVMWPDPDSF